MTDLLNYTLFGIEVRYFAAALGAILLGFLLQKIANVTVAKVSRLTEKNSFEFDDIIFRALAGPVGWVFGLGGIYAAFLILPVPKEAEAVHATIDALVKGATMVLAVWFGLRLADGFGAKLLERAAGTDSKIDDQIIPIIHRSLKVFIVVIGIVLVLQNLGYSVSSLLAGFGLGGAALALASKDTIANLFGSMVIFLDRPFQVGDWIDVGPVEGTVEEVGLRTTRVRTFANSLISMPNAAFTTTAINNWSRMQKRRIKMTIGVTYDTPAEKVQAAVDYIRRLIVENEKIHDDNFHVYFDNFGPSSLDIFIYCFTVSTNWGEFLTAKQDFLLKIMRGFEELGIEFAFPTQTVHLAGAGGDGKAPDGEIRQRPL